MGGQSWERHSLAGKALKARTRVQALAWGQWGNHGRVLSSEGCGQPFLGKLHTSLLPCRGSRTAAYPPLPPKKDQELGWAGLPVVTLFFCLQRDPGRGEQRAEGGLASHSEYPLSLRSLAWCFRHIDIRCSLVGSLIPGSPIFKGPPL